MIKNKGLRSGRIKREDIAMKNEKISRRSFLKASAVASALGVMVNLYAMGVGAEKFGGVYDNTEVFHKLAELTSVQ